MDDSALLEPLRLIGLVSENVKRLVGVDLTGEMAPDPYFVIIGGNNGQGKSSLMDSIEWGITGKPPKTKVPRPIRDGQTSARVLLDLGSYTIERMWRSNDDSRIVLRRSDGSVVSSPQGILDGLANEMAFDPLQLIRMAPRVQRDALLAVVPLDVDLDQLEQDRKAAYDQRTGLNSQRDAVGARRAAIPAIDIPADVPSIADAMEAHRIAAAVAAANQAQRAAFHRADTKLTDAVQRLREAEAALAAAQQMKQDAFVAWEAEQTKFSALTPDPDVEALATRINEAQHWAEQRQIQSRAEELDREHGILDAESDECSRFIEECDASKKGALERAKMPVAGLSFDGDTGISFNGYPFSQASAAEQLKVAAAIAMSGNPRIRVMVIRDGSLLDADSMRLLHDLAVEHNFQVWIERVGDADASAVIIEEGLVRGAIETSSTEA